MPCTTVLVTITESSKLYLIGFLRIVNKYICFSIMLRSRMVRSRFIVAVYLANHIAKPCYVQRIAYIMMFKLNLEL